jgi:hypothetical protein
MKVVQNDDCTFTATVGHSLHFKDDQGDWQVVNLNFHSDGHGGAIEDQSDVTVKVAGATVEATERTSGKGIKWVTPGAPAVSGQKATVQDQGLTWEYATSKSGLKVNALVQSSLGPKTYKFPYHMVGGAAELTVDSNGTLVSDVLLVPRPVVYGADMQRYNAGAWTLPQPHKATFSFDDSSLPASAYPYVIDPTTTFTLGSRGADPSNIEYSGDDATGRSTSSAGAYPPEWTEAQIDSSSPFVAVEKGVILPPQHLSPDYAVSNGLLRWDTRLEEGARVEAATLVFSTSVGSFGGGGGNAPSTSYSPCASTDTDGRALVMEWQDPGSWGAEDYSPSPGPGWIASVPLSDFSRYLPEVEAIPLDDVGGVNTQGDTAIRLSISGGQPVGQNSVCIASWDDPTLPEPHLSINYVIPPSIDSLSAIAVELHYGGFAPQNEPYVGDTFRFTATWSDFVNTSARLLILRRGRFTQTLSGIPGMTPLGLTSET